MYDGLMTGATGIFILALTIFLIVLAILLFLMPFFVFRIRNEMIKMNSRMDKVVMLLEELTENSMNIINLGDPMTENKTEAVSKLYEKGYKAYKAKRFNRAVEYLSQAIDLSFKDPEIYFARGTCYQKLKKIDKAIQDFEIAANLGHRKAERRLKKLIKRNA